MAFRPPPSMGLGFGGPPPGPPPPPAGSSMMFSCEPPGPPDCPPPKGPPPAGWCPAPGPCGQFGAAPPPKFPMQGMSGLNFPPGVGPDPNLDFGEVPPGFPPGFPGFPLQELSEVPLAGPMPAPVPKGPPPQHLPEPAEAADTAAASVAESAAREKRRAVNSSKVEGIAPAKRIKTGGAVTVYDGYTATQLKPSKEAGNGSKYDASASSTAAASLKQPAAVKGREALERQLPPGWEMKKSRSTGKVYYVNEKDGKTQWEPPVGSSATVQADSKKRKEAAAAAGTSRAKDAPDAQVTSKNGMVGLVRGKQQTMGRWQKWQKTSNLINAEDEGE